MALLTLLLAGTDPRRAPTRRVLGLTVDVDGDGAVYDHEEVRALTPLPCTFRARSMPLVNSHTHAPCATLREDVGCPT